MTNIQAIIKKTIPVLAKHQVKKSSIFGSFAHGDNKKDSDIDILVELKDGKTLLDLVSLEMDIEKEINKKVDVITYNSIHPLLKDSILRNEIKIYG
ncbi:MAG: nucleotidyltransferase family protein [bacterium]